MKRLLFAVLALTALALGQSQLPNIKYNASLNTTCATPNGFCAGSVYTASPGVSGLSGSALDVNSDNYAVATVTVSGTYSGATINFDFADPVGGISYFQELCTRTDANILEASEVLPTNQIRAWQCPVFATTRFRVRLSAISSGAVNVWIALTQSSIDPSPTIAALEANVVGSTDPCQNPQVIKSSVPIAISTATTTQLVALSGTTSIYVCHYDLSVAGTSPSVLFEYGTGASCGTGTTALTGTYLISIGNELSAGWGGMLFKTAAGNALCVVSGGTTPSLQGVLTYVQQ